MLESQGCLGVMYDLHFPPMGHLQLSISRKTDRGNERWGIYLPCWHCFCLVSSELTHLLKCWVETSTYYRAELLSRDCVLCVEIEMKAVD